MIIINIFLVWIAIVLFVCGLFIEKICDASRHLWVSYLGWVLVIAGFVLACMQNI